GGRAGALGLAEGGGRLGGPGGGVQRRGKSDGGPSGTMLPAILLRCRRGWRVERRAPDLFDYRAAWRGKPDRPGFTLPPALVLPVVPLTAGPFALGLGADRGWRIRGSGLSGSRGFGCGVAS